MLGQISFIVITATNTLRLLSCRKDLSKACEQLAKICKVEHPSEVVKDLSAKMQDAAAVEEEKKDDKKEADQSSLFKDLR